MFYVIDIINYAFPLIPLMLGVILLFLLIKQSIIRKKLLKGRLIFTFLIVLGCALILAFYSEISKDLNKLNIINWCLLASDLIISICYVIFCEISSSKEQFNKDLFLTLDKTKLYVLLDRKNRIKEISEKFLNDLEIDYNDAYNKNFFEVIEMKYQIFKLNGTNAEISDLNIFFRSPETKETSLNLEIHDKNGDASAYYLQQRPIYVFSKFKGRIFIGDKKSTEQLLGIEKNLAESTGELDMIKSRFITILEKTNEGIFFQNLTDRTIWLNDVLKEKLCLNNNEMLLADFIDNIHPEDLALYKEKHNSINNINPRYSLSYRYNTGNRSIYIKEEGSRITNGKVVELCGIIRIIDGQKVDRNNSFIDKVYGEPEMYSSIDRLYKENQTFQVVLMKLTSIEQMNKKYGRAFGDMVISEYVKWINNKFVDVNLIYRVSGLEFVFIITDYRKMEILKKELANDEKILHMGIQFGNNKAKVEAAMGICYSSDGINSKDLYNKAQETLRICSKEQYLTNYAYYKDIC